MPWWLDSNGTYLMRATILILPAMLALGACNSSDRTAKDLNNAASQAGDSITNLASDVGEVASNAGDAIGNGIDQAGNVIEANITHDGWVGRWKGVEGTYLTIEKGKEAGRYRIHNQFTLDDKGSFDGHATVEGIAFTRPDGKQVLRASSGDATGVKYLAGKQNCLKVKDGEGYCRD